MINSTEFMENFPGFCLQTFDDRKEKDKSLTRCGSPEQLSWQDLKVLNQQGAGVFFSPNAFPQGIRKKGHCKGVNAWFFEIDDASFDDQWKRIESAPLHPDIIVKTRKSLHCYYLAKDATVEQFMVIQKGLIKYFDADKACKDITRVLRVPGFTHNKEEPIEVKIVHYEPKKFSEADMLKAFPYEELVKSVNPKLEKKFVDSNDFWSIAAKFNNKDMLQKLSGTKMVNGETFSFRERPGGGEYIDVNDQESDAWIDTVGNIGSGKNGGPTYIQWLEFYGRKKDEIATWIKENCADLLPTQMKEEKKKSKNQSEMLYELFLVQYPVIFKDQMGEGYVSVQVDSRNRIMKSESSKFSKYLGRLYYQETGMAISSEAVKKTANLISANAEYGLFQYEIFNRVAKQDDVFWYDLGNGKAVRIVEDAWKIVDNVPILFKSHQHQNTQILPCLEKANLKLILNHVRIRKKDQQILFLVWLVAAFVPGIPHPILALYGEKGASKSTTMRLARSLIDPSKTALLSLPSANELVQQLAHHYAPCYDNVTKISAIVSDMLCRGVTGAGSSKRRLFTDDDDVIYQYRRVIALNGINNAVQNPDLLDRSILIELARIPKTERKTESQLNKSFNKDKPIILAGIFEALSKAMSVVDKVELTEFPRMADFAQWGCAISEAIGFAQQQFMDAYNANIDQQNDEVLNDDPVAHCICHLMGDNQKWEGSPSELLRELNSIAFDLFLDGKAMPRSPSVLGKHIKLVKSNLLEAGIRFEDFKDRAGKRGRYYVLTKFPDAPVAELGCSDSSDGSDGK